MARLIVILSFILYSVVLQGCAPVTVHPDVDPVLAAKEAEIQRRMAIEERVKLFTRLTDVSASILVNGTSLCGKTVTYFLGMDTNSIDAIPKEWREAYREVLGLGEQVKITHIIQGSPAMKGGLKDGDIILMVNGEKVEPGDNCYKRFNTMLTTQLEAGQTMTFWIERDGLPQMHQVEPEKRCDYPVVMTDDMVINAYADGDSVFVTKGMMQFATDDRELALVVGHELGHNVMGHISKQTGNRLMGAVLDGLIAGLSGVQTSFFTNQAGMMFSQDFEKEADYVGMYFMARGGYDCSDVAMFWRRMGANAPYAIGHATTHPTSASRYVFLDECYKEIREKEESGQELVPEIQQTAKAK